MAAKKGTPSPNGGAGHKMAPKDNKMPPAPSGKGAGCK
jgi:hypothetical protein